METKKEIRKQILQKRDALSVAERQQKSRKIMQKVMQSEGFQNSSKLLLFASCKSEVDTTGIMQHAIAAGKELYLPKVTGLEMEFYRISDVSELEEGYCGIKEPKAEHSQKFMPKEGENVFILLPGAVFDKEGGRIGYGKGFYDRFLGKLEKIVEKTNLCKIAVAFGCQIVDNGRIAREAHDILPDYIITEECILCLAANQKE
uniref:5-formyltetrahydrofolate cyclo-ligase n=1 Tax=Agathobacter sp. TaxID=2021311 RepID=UPI00405672E3